MKAKILVTGGFVSDHYLHELHLKGFEVKNITADLDEKELIEEIKDVNAYILGGVERVTSKVINAAKSLKIISFIGVGYQNFIPASKEAQNKGILITNTPGANTETAAEMTWSLLFALQRRVPYLNGNTKRGEWGTYKSHELKGATLGIVGMGSIGTTVARQAYYGFNMKVIYHSRSAKPDIEKELGATKTSLKELLKSADVISLHCSLNSETRGLIGEKELALLKQNALLINMAPSDVIDPKALYECLSNRRITGAAMDGYYIEPAPTPDKDPYKLLSLPDDIFVITPHIGGQTFEASNRMSEMAIESVLCALKGGSVPRVVIS